MSGTSNTTGYDTNIDGFALYSLHAGQFTFAEYFTPTLATDFKFLSGLPGFPYNATVTVQPDAKGTGLDVVGTGIFSGVSETDLFPNRHFTATTTVDLQFISTNGGGFELTFTAPVNCFTAGVLIDTADGERPVETIVVGDMVLADGRQAPVTWVGSHRIRVADAADPDMVLPIRIRSDAIASGLPWRDLVVSPDHAIWVDGKLIPARLLVNGVTIVQERREEVEYFHIALDRHDLLLAEGLQVESYLDVEGVLAAMAPGVTPLHRLAVGRPPALTVYETHGYAPLTIEAELVRPVWNMIAERAGPAIAANDLVADELAAAAGAGGAPFAVVIDGQTHPVTQIGFDGTETIFRCILPKQARRVALVSGAASPWSTAPWLDDRRCLGIAISALAIVDDHGVRALPITDPTLRDGWHDVETGPVAYRWTNGRATLPVPDGASMLDVSIVGVANLRRIAVAA